jgi:hypothetical protein
VPTFLIYSFDNSGHIYGRSDVECATAEIAGKHATSIAASAAYVEIWCEGALVGERLAKKRRGLRRQRAMRTPSSDLQQLSPS